MLEFDNIRLDLESYEVPVAELKDALHIDRVSDQISEYENRMQEPDFWNNVEKATEIQQTLGRLKKKVESYNALCAEREDLLALCELANEEEDLDSLEELKTSSAKFKEDFEKMRLETLLTGPYDANNATITLHAGAGGTEAMDWCSMLYRMYTRWAESHGFSVEELDYVEGDTAGIQSVSLMVKGDYAYGFLRSELGVHRLVRISPFDAAGRRHTSFASCEVIPELDQKTEDDIKIDMSDVRVDTYRATGKGGQHINKTDTAVRMTHNPTGIVVSCQAERSQLQNKETCLRMLKAKLFALARASEMEKIEDLKGNQMEIAWGSQIRSYVFCPYTLVKDNRTGYEEVDVDSVMDGNLDGFINAYLSGMKNEK